MPIYEYRCAACQHKFDTLQKFSDAPLVDCPQCGKPALRKQVTAAGFQLKGSGWYQTDFRGGKEAPAGADSKSAATADGKAAGDTKADAGGKSADAPATKADTVPAKSETSKSETSATPASSPPAAA
ncbi:MAG: zinc ribbon domain-containing protein [Burkholderiales bacterium]|nr:zinc ribbon domain-containing protein [Burkholderiales bacterium]